MLTVPVTSQKVEASRLPQTFFITNTVTLSLGTPTVEPHSEPLKPKATGGTQVGHRQASIADILRGSVPPVALGFKGSEWGSKLVQAVSNNGENIACVRESLGMRPRNLRPCGRQPTP